MSEPFFTDPDPDAEPESDESLLRAAPGLARIAATAWLRTARWTVGTSARAGSRIVRAAARGESPAELFQSTGAEVRDTARRLLGIGDGEDADADAGGFDRHMRGSDFDPDASPSALRERGSELLRRSADVRFEEDAHPAYARILSELAPDEARILRFMALEGPQGAVDVRTGRPLNVGSQMIAPGLSMIGQQAGCRNLDRVHSYLNNLYRLGLIWFSREPLEDPLRYQVLEAQPDVLEAMREAGRGKTIRRSIALTSFGADFCATCLPLQTVEIDALPGDGQPQPQAEPRSRP